MTKKEVYKKIVDSDELRKKFESLTDKTSLESFLAEIGYDGDAEDFIAFVKSVNEGEIDDEDAQVVAGGKPKYPIL